MQDNTMQEETKPSEISMREYMDLLRRRKGILIQTFVVVFVVGVIVTFMTKPLYRTQARVLVEGKSYYVTQFDPGNPMGNLFSADAGHEVDTQLEVIQGEKVVAETYKMAGVPAGTVRMSAKQSGTTDVIDVITESNTPLYAQKFANTLPAVYLNYVTGNRRTEIKKALAYAQNQLDTEQKALKSGEDAMQKFRERSKVTNVDTERTARITSVQAAKADVEKTAGLAAGLQARLNALEQAQKTLPPYVETPTTTTNTQIQNMRASIDTLNTQREALLILYKPASVKVQEVDAQIAHLNGLIALAPATTTQVQRVPNVAVTAGKEKIAATRAELQEANAHLAGLKNATSQDSDELNKYGGLEQEQARLQREIDRHTSKVALFTKSADDLSLRATATHDPVLVISPAGPAGQIAPRPMNNMLAATLIGLTLGLCFAMLQEFMDDRINTPEEAKRIFGVAALGYIPLVEDADARLLGRTRGGNLLETYRVLRTNVNFSGVDAPIQSIMVTSTVPGEGKSMTAYNLAVAMALDGRRVILVDADLRRPTVHKSCGLERRPGLTNVLVGELALDEALQNTHVRNMRVLTAGPLPPNPAEILNSKVMRRIHADLRERADIVIYDTPPCLATADAQVLSADVDGVLYVAQFGATKKSAMRRSAELLEQAHANLLGVVFNKIDISGNRDDYYYGYYRYYNYYQGDNALTEEGSSRRFSTNEFDLLMQRHEDEEAGSGNEREANMTATNATTSSALVGTRLPTTLPIVDNEGRPLGEPKKQEEKDT